MSPHDLSAHLRLSELSPKIVEVVEQKRCVRSSNTLQCMSSPWMPIDCGLAAVFRKVDAHVKVLLARVLCTCVNICCWGISALKHRVLSESALTYLSNHVHLRPGNLTADILLCLLDSSEYLQALPSSSLTIPRTSHRCGHDSLQSLHRRS